ncbi:MAG: type IV pili methyl-accepting chemotaxis transducer N-terminal domain-containing protein, partial [Planctomycetota bacterium]
MLRSSGDPESREFLFGVPFACHPMDGRSTLITLRLALQSRVRCSIFLSTTYYCRCCLKLEPNFPGKQPRLFCSILAEVKYVCRQELRWGIARQAIWTFVAKHSMQAQDLDQSTEILSRRIRWRYGCALLAVAGLMICSQFYLQRVIISQREDAALINIAGKQRMLSQKLTKNALLLSRAADADIRSDVTDELNQILLEWKAAHRKIFPTSDSHVINNDERFKRRQLLETSFLAMVSGAEGIRENVADKAALASQLNLILQHERAFLESMDWFVDAFEEEAKLRVSRLQFAETVIFFVFLGTLVLECFLVFEPLNRRIVRQFRELTAAKSRAEELSVVAKFAEKGVIIADGEGRIQWVNDAFEWITGFRQGEVINVKLLDFLKDNLSDEDSLTKLESQFSKLLGCDATLKKKTKFG